MIRADFHVLDVGQGSMNFVEVYSGLADRHESPTPEKLLTTFLFDAGSQRFSMTSKSPKQAGARASVAWVVDRLNAMVAKKGRATIGALVLSHGDKDHKNLLGAILDAFDKPDEGTRMLEIGLIFYSGSYDAYGVGGENMLTLAGKYSRIKHDNPMSVNYNQSSFRTDPWSHLFLLPGVATIYLVAGNSTVNRGINEPFDPKHPSAAEINTGSLVTVLRVGTSNFVVTGDATAETMAWCTKHLGLNRLNAFHLTVPHHGAGFTAYNISPTTKKDVEHAAVEIAKRRITDVARRNHEEFTSVMSAQSISASAGQGSSYGHPEARVLRDYSAHFRTRAERHLITINCEQDVFLSDAPPARWPGEDEKEGFRSLWTECPIYTTQYGSEEKEVYRGQRWLLEMGTGENQAVRTSDKPLITNPEGVNWRFTAFEDGTTDEPRMFTHAAILAAAADGDPMPEAMSVAEFAALTAGAPSRLPPRPRGSPTAPPEPPRALKLIG